MSQPTVHLMRGLPSCGKSYTAARLAGADGVVCTTDEYFYTEVGDDPTRFDYRSDLLETARRWNFERFCRAVDDRRSPIVVDRGNGLNVESQVYVRYAFDRDYRVELTEPASEWWQELRVLLKYKEHTGPVLDDWAVRLAEMNRATHRTPAATIRRWMAKWRSDLTVEQILRYRPPVDDGGRIPGV